MVVLPKETQMLHRWATLLLCVGLAGCAVAPPAARPDHLFNDAAFAPPSQRIDAADVFALNDAMRQYLRVDIARQLAQQGRLRGLVQAMYQRDQLKLDYDTGVTRNAAEAFEARAGNCLSLVIMTAALAKELGLQVTYKSAWAEEAWSRTGNTYFRSGHVVVVIGKRSTDIIGSGYENNAVTVDFMPQPEGRSLRTSWISEQVIIAMFMNNRAAEAMVRGRLDDAYWWARAAVLQSPDFLSPYNTLALIYRRHGDLAQAEKVFRYALALEPDNTRTMFNLAQLLEHRGRSVEAAALQRRLAQLEPLPPFHYFNLGIAAMQKSDFRTARDLFAKEVARAEYYHEFHYWLGLASYRLGDYERANKHLALAIENSPTPGDRNLYSAKLAWMRSHGYQ
jgi:tetratricopeptide (TPR) repeat protein